MQDFFLFHAIRAQVSIKKALGATGENENVDFKTLNPFGDATLLDIFKRILAFGRTLAVLVMPIMVIWGAFLILTASGKPDNLKKGRMVIMWAIIGFIIILAAEGVTELLQDILIGDKK